MLSLERHDNYLLLQSSRCDYPCLECNLQRKRFVTIVTSCYEFSSCHTPYPEELIEISERIYNLCQDKHHA